MANKKNESLPTFAQISNAELPVNKIDGVGILSLLKNEDKANPRSHFFYYCQKNSLEAVTDGRWKLVFPHKFRTYENNQPGQDGSPGAISYGTTELMLFDLRRDQGERYDVKEMNPEIVAKLQQLADEAREDLGDDLTGEEGKNRRPVGMNNN
jgi:arylsulfatase A-like enzyme